MNAETPSTGVLCPSCHRFIPSGNLQIHSAWCHQSRRSMNTSDYEEEEEEDERKPAAIDLTNTATPPQNRPVIHDLLDDDDDAVVDMQDDDDDERKVAAMEDNDDEDNDVEEIEDDEVLEFWPCTRCTLHNTNDTFYCTACGTHRPRRNARIFPSNNHRDTPTPFVTHGALLGGIMGAATGAYMHGSPTMLNDVVPGAVSGAVGGALLREMMQPHLRTSIARMGTPPPVRRTTTSTTFHSPASSLNPMIQHLMAQAMEARAGAATNVDGMSYDQLLQRFGNGTENMGASALEISQLPLATITDVHKELPEDCRTCFVCYETFEAGEQRRTLPCLHGFHQACIDKWLQSNGTCPICKHSLRDNSAS